MTQTQFYNLVLFMSSIAVFSLVAQRMSAGRSVLGLGLGVGGGEL